MMQVEFTPSPRILRGLDQIAGYLYILMSYQDVAQSGVVVS